MFTRFLTCWVVWFILFHVIFPPAGVEKDLVLSFIAGGGFSYWVGLIDESMEKKENKDKDKKQ